MFVIQARFKNSKITTYYMNYDIIKAKNINELRKKINKSKGLVVVEGGDDNINRAAVENSKVDILLSPEKSRRKDVLYVRNSGLNQVLCKLARDNEVAIGFNFNDVLETENKEVIVGRMMQNVRLCRKYKVAMVFDCFGERKVDKINLISFARLLGMSPGEAKQSLEFKKKNKSKIKLLKNG